MVRILGNVFRFKNSRPHLGAYVHLIKITYSIGSLILISPIRVVFDVKQRRYVVRRCALLQMLGCFLIQCLSSISAAKMLKSMWTHLLANPKYIGAYFDFMNGVILHCYSITLIYFQWFRVQTLDHFVEVLQVNPLIQHCPLALWKAKILPTFFWCLTIYMAFIWLPIVFQINFSSYEGFMISCEGAAQDFFRVRPGASGIQILGFVAILGKFYHGFFIHLAHNVFGTVSLYCAYFLAREFSNFVNNSDSAQIESVLAMYKEYKLLLKSVNRVVTPFNIHFVAMTLTYHSLHLFDALNATIPLWKLNTYLYILYLVNFLYLPVKTLLLVKQCMRKYIWSQNNYVLMSREQLAVVLNDFRYDGLAIKGGGYFTVSAAFSGKVIQQLIYYSMLNTLAVHQLAI